MNQQTRVFTVSEQTSHWGDEAAAKTEAARLPLQAFCIERSIALPSDFLTAYCPSFLCSSSDFLDMVIAGFKIKFESETLINIPLPEAPTVNIAALEHMGQARTAPLNTVVNVMVPGNTLSTFDEVAVWEDCCTDSLQRQLRDGWRILAICPQPDQRRPDYILGRNSNHET